MRTRMEVVMEASAVVALSEHFESLEDPRVERTKLHSLLAIVTIAICAVICGAETWNDIEEFGDAKVEWLATFLDLPHGIPTHDTFNRVFAALNPEQFRTCFVEWMQAAAGVLNTQVIALDGKTVRRSHERGEGKGAIHMVSAWATTNRLILAQTKVDAKSNEITALPEVLGQLAISGCVVTIDAMGCQREIAQQILDQDADYVLALKGNQGTLHQDVADTFTLARAAAFADIIHDTAETLDKGHGRIEHRRSWVVSDPDTLQWLQDHHHWPGLGAIGAIDAERQVGDQRTSETRYYLLNRPLSAAAFGAAVRSHWGIENRVHWVLDLAFHEDQSRIREGNAAENFVVLRHLALNLLQRHPTKRRLSIKARRLKAAWDHAYLLQVLNEF